MLGGDRRCLTVGSLSEQSERFLADWRLKGLVLVCSLLSLPALRDYLVLIMSYRLNKQYTKRNDLIFSVKVFYFCLGDSGDSRSTS